MANKTTESQEQAVRKLRRLIKDIRFCMMTTVDTHASLRSRPMAVLDRPFDGTLYFFTHRSDPKVREIARDARVNLGISDPDSYRYVSCSGVAGLANDPTLQQKLWHKQYEAWFPKGLDDKDLAMLRVRVTNAEYWHGPSSSMVQLTGFLKARLTGKPASGSTSRKVQMSRSGRTIARQPRG